MHEYCQRKSSYKKENVNKVMLLIFVTESFKNSFSFGNELQSLIIGILRPQFPTDVIVISLCNRALGNNSNPYTSSSFIKNVNAL